MNPLVSVIVPVKNRERLLLRSLESIKGQTYRPLEVIVVDNGSTDDTLRVAQEWGNANSGTDFKVMILSESKPGVCAARNRGLSQATGKLTVFFDSDDTMRPQLIECAVEEFKKSENTDIVCWKVDIHQLDGTLRQPPFNPDKPLEDHLVNALLRTQGYMAHTEDFRKAGGWNENLMGWNDWELGVRMLLRSDKVVGINEVLVDVYSLEDSITGKDFSSKAGRWEKAIDAVRKDIEGSGHADKSRLLTIVAYREIILAAHYAKEGRADLAETLKGKVLANGNGGVKLSLKDKCLLRLAYSYTKRGGRGAWRILRHVL